MADNTTETELLRFSAQALLHLQTLNSRVNVGLFPAEVGGILSREDIL